MVPPLQFDGWEWAALALATPVVLWAGWPFHRAAFRNARHRAVTMDTLISIGTLAAWAWSTVVLVGGIDAEMYFEVGAVIVTLILVGRYLEERAKSRAGAAVRALLELGAKEARVLRNGEEVLVPIAELEVGDRFVVRPGEKIATDGIVEEGESAIDQSMLTGESVPVEVGSGAEIAGGTINTYGRLVVRATRVGEETALAQIARLVAEAQAGKAPVQRLADRVSAVFVPVVIGIALATLAGWLVFTGDAGEAFTAAVAVLIIACPCALGLATPTALMVGTGRAAQLGILIKGPEVLEETRRISTIVLDKTGTVTEGRIELVDVRLMNGADRTEVLRLAGALEDASEHPIAQAVAAAAKAELGAAAAGGGVRQPARRRRRRARRRPRGRGRAHERRDHRLLGRRAPRHARRSRHRQAHERRGGSRASRVRPDPGPADRRQQARQPNTSPARWASSRSSPRCCPERRRPRSGGCRKRARSWPWSETASTTRRRLRKPISASPSAPAPTSPSRPRTSRSCPATCARPPTRSGSPVERYARSRPTSSGRSPTTSPLFRWPSPACSARSSPRRPWRSPACSSSPTVCDCAGSTAARGGTRMTHGYSQHREQLVNRLHRIEGQVRGIERMVEEDRYCIDVITQISAVTTALESLAFEILDDHVSHCVAGALESGDADVAAEKREELLAAVRRFAKTR